MRAQTILVHTSMYIRVDHRKVGLPRMIHFKCEFPLLLNAKCDEQMRQIE